MHYKELRIKTASVYEIKTQVYLIMLKEQLFQKILKTCVQKRRLSLKQLSTIEKSR